MKVDPAHAAGSHSHGGVTYWFCSQGCLEKFRREPERYVGGQNGGDVAAGGPPHPTRTHGGAAVSNATVYTCPMHPEVRQDHPGPCPKCGMALEPLMPAAPPAV